MKKVMMIYGMMIALFFTACMQDGYSSVEETVKEEEPKDIEKSILRVSFSLNGYGTYASTEDKDKDSGEITVNTPLELYVFSENGPFYGYYSLGLTGSASNYTSDEFELPVGNWYMYAFVNKPANLFPQPANTTSYMDFELQKIKLVMVSHRTFMGTLVREKKTVYGTGSTGSPEHIKMSIGHILSKVNVNSNTPEVKGKLKGTFSKNPLTNLPWYVIGNRPTYTYLVGQWEGPFRQFNSQVISPHYISYDLDSDFDSPRYPEPSLGMPYYTMENTNQIPRGENSSCFILKYTYKPHPDETHDANHKTGNSTNNKGFWVAEFQDGQQLIYNIEPSGLAPHPVAGPVVSFLYHGNYECYYRVFIADDSEAKPSQIYSTIRNHYYFLTVNSISGLGTYPEDNWPDEKKPLPIDKDIDVTLDVKNWIPYEIPVNLE